MNGYYAASIFAMKPSNGDVSHSLLLLKAGSDSEALLIAYGFALETWPMDQGWVEHNAIVQVTP